MKKPVYYVLIGVLLLVFCFSAFQIVNYFIKGREKANQFDELSQLASQGVLHQEGENCHLKEHLVREPPE